MANNWHSYGAAGNYDELFEQLAPEVPFEPPEPDKGVNIWITILVWAVTLFISVGISFLIFCFDFEEEEKVIDIWYIIRYSSVLKDIGLVLFVEIATYLFCLYKQKGFKLEIKDSQFVIHLVSLVFAVCDTFLYQKFMTMGKETIFKLVLWLVLVICSCLVCVLGQVEIPKKQEV